MVTKLECLMRGQPLLYFEACTTLGMYLPSRGSNPRHGFYETIPFCSHLISDTCQSPNNHLPAKKIRFYCQCEGQEEKHPTSRGLEL